MLRHGKSKARSVVRSVGYPLTPLLFIAFSSWMVVHAVHERPVEALFGVLTIASGLVVWAIVRHFHAQSTNQGGSRS